MANDVPAQRIWEAALGRLQLAVTRPAFDTYLRDTTGSSLDDGRLVVEVATPFAAAWLEKQMHGLVEGAVSTVARTSVEVTYQIKGTQAAFLQELPNAAVGTSANASSTPNMRDKPFTAALNSAYTFDNFVVGGSNQLAHAASVAAASGQSQSYNPLFLYSGVGLGKTHLLHSIGHRASAAGRRVAYVTTEQFTNEYLASIRERRGDEFRERYRSVDVLLIDDIQFLSGKEGTQEAFFHTFNALRNAGRQVVITCDRSPAAVPSLEERLRSRLEWGLMADINTPDLETRTVILQTHAARAPVAVPAEVIEFIASRVPSNIRHLEGCLNRVTALAHFTQQPVTIDLAVNALGTVAKQQAGPTSPKAAIAAVAAYYNIPSSAMVGGRRDRPAAQARQIAMYLLRHTFGLTPEEIGQTLGNRDRTTVLYSIKQVARKLEQDASFAAALAQLAASLETSSNTAGPQ